MQLLDSAKWSKWSAREIAKACGVSPGFVNGIKFSLLTVGRDTPAGVNRLHHDDERYQRAPNRRILLNQYTFEGQNSAKSSWSRLSVGGRSCLPRSINASELDQSGHTDTSYVHNEQTHPSGASIFLYAQG